MLEALGPGPLSPVTARFRALVGAMLSPALPVRLDNQTETEVQLRIERPDKPPEYIVILDAVKEDERSLQLRLARLTSESVADQHVVVLSNQGWLPEVLTKAAATYGSRLKLYQVDSDGKVVLGSPSGPLATAQPIRTGSRGFWTCSGTSRRSSTAAPGRVSRRRSFATLDEGLP